MEKLDPKLAPSSKDFLQNLDQNINELTAMSPNETTLLFQTIKNYLLPRLPLLDNLAQLVQSRCPGLFNNTVIVAYQHLLGTTGSLFKSLIQAGVKPDNIFICGKCYSTVPEVVEAIKQLGIKYVNPGTVPKISEQFLNSAREDADKIWGKVQKYLSEHKEIVSILVLDDGALVSERIPKSILKNYRCAVVEQTRNGLSSKTIQRFPIPVIEVASSAAKCYLEPPIIVAEVIRSVLSHLQQGKLPTDQVFGVVGYGAIGQAIAHFLVSRGCDVRVFDRQIDKISSLSKNQRATLAAVDNLAELFEIADIIFGCTGEDITAGLHFNTNRASQKTLISSSSRDIEFRSLIEYIGEKTAQVGYRPNPLATLDFRWHGCNIIIMGGGFPINFDRKITGETLSEIEVTRGLLFGALIQARFVARKVSQLGTENLITESPLNYRHMHDPLIQQVVALHWLPRVTSNETINQQKPELFKKFSDLQWIVKNSGGEYQENSELMKLFRPEIQKLMWKTEKLMVKSSRLQSMYFTKNKNSTAKLATPSLVSDDQKRPVYSPISTAQTEQQNHSENYLSPHFKFNSKL